LIAINRDTGTVTWGSFVLDMRLAPDALVRLEPELMPVHNDLGPDGRRTRIYHLPTIKIDEYPLMLEAVFVNQRLSGINIKRGGSTYTDEEYDRWWRQLPGWIKIAQKWLVAQLGQPHEIKSGVLFDEQELLTPDEIQFLQSWDYKFEWGRAGFYYDGLQMPGEIYVHHDYHQQIRNWNELLDECRLLLRNQIQQNGKYIASLVATRSLIEVVAAHFDFQIAKPYVNCTGLVFPLTEWNTQVVVTVWPFDIEYRYEISRHDTTRKAFVADGDHIQLVQQLRVFLETEEL
jgi:hypothetical protein